MVKGNHDIAAIANQVNDAAVLGTRKAMGLEEHRRSESPIIWLLVNVRNECLRERGWRERWMDPVYDGCYQILKPGVSRLGVTNDEDIFRGEFLDAREPAEKLFPLSESFSPFCQR